MAKGSGKKETPLMKQYNAIKAKHPSTILLFRVGDFYETFGEDAISASRILGITLTKRSNGSASEVELAGFPHHSLNTYLPKLVKAGQRVAVCDQLEDPKQAKGIVKRGVTELVTPGLSMNDQVLEQGVNNFLASIHAHKQEYGIALLDISTGEFLVSQGSVEFIQGVLSSYAPAEVIFNKREQELVDRLGYEAKATYSLEDWAYSQDFANERLLTHYGVATLKGFGVDDLPLGLVAAGAVLQYLEYTEHKELGHLSYLTRIPHDMYVWLDRFTIRHLELAHAQQQDGVPLLQVMDATLTAMGSRMLKKWALLPLREKAHIMKRQSIVAALVGNTESLDDLRVLLKGVFDLERLASKLATKRINPKELQSLKQSLKQVQEVEGLLTGSGMPLLEAFAQELELCTALVDKVDRELKEDCPTLVSQGNVIADGVNEEIDRLRGLAYKGKDLLTEIQLREIERTGITSLKISYNKVFGYYLEVTNAHKDKVPEEWVRKQTLVNAERYITQELKEYEEQILSAEEKLGVLESELYARLVEEAIAHIREIQQSAHVVAQLDCLASFAQCALDYGYVQPVITEEYSLDIVEGRHPVIERMLPPGEAYIPNDVFFDKQQQIMVITGPNMAGKSALLRQTALIVLMAQMGGFVPATKATVGLVDKVFTRVGASDNLSKGESTFMVEMTETASILNNISSRSLVLMDEIGRGTSTYDGISIAWSILEFLHNFEGASPKTMFATHYHELNELAKDYHRIRNYNVSVRETKNKVIFLRKLKEGGSEHSFGIHVAQMAGLPMPVVLRAGEILQQLEKDKLSEATKTKLEKAEKLNYQLNLFDADPASEEIRVKLNSLEINNMTPMDALLALQELKKMLGS